MSALAPAPAPEPAPDAPLTTSTVVLLQSMRGYPSISILLSTTPGPRLAADDLMRLLRLRDDAARRLREEGLPGVADLVSGLDDLIEQAREVRPEAALGLFVSRAHRQLVLLPVEVRERVAIDPTFATRDLVRALHRTPRHVMLLLSARQAKLFEGQGGSLVPAQGARFPREHLPALPRRDNTDFLTDVDGALGTYLRLHPAPLVIAGAEPTVSRFLRLSRNTRRLAGVLPGNRMHTDLRELAALSRPLIESYLRSRQEEALELLDRRTGQDRAVLGIDAVWLAARWERPEMLAVEQGFFYPARLSSDGDRLQAAEDVEHPDVIDDAVDEVIERVLDRGGWVALVDDGAIGGDARIALTLRG